MSTDFYDETVELLVAPFHEKGYEVFQRPSAKIVPQSLRLSKPDAIALRGGEKIAIYVLRRDERSRLRIEAAQKAIADLSGWQIHSVWLNQLSTDGVPKQSHETIAKTLVSARKLLEQGETQAALVQAFSSFEAIARAFLPDLFSKPQRPGSVIEGMAHHGHILPEEADLFRSLSSQRNAVVHGALDQQIEPQSVRKMIDELEYILPAAFQAVPEPAAE